jgi:YVTN family beta-propeller protein
MRFRASTAAIFVAAVLSAGFLAATSAPPPPLHFVGEGIAVDLTVTPVSAEEPSAVLHAGQAVRVRFALSDTASRTPLSGLYPEAWMDGKGAEACSAKIASLLAGSLFTQPALDLNSYSVLVMNEDASLSVLDPYQSFGGTRLLAMVPLAAPAEDWTLAEDSSRLYASLPTADQVAVVDTAVWKVVRTLQVGLRPGRLALEPGGGAGRRLWVVHGERESALANIANISAVALPDGPVTEVTVGPGPHRLAFSPDGRKLYVTNAGDGTVSIVDTRKLAEVKRLPAGRTPSAVAYSSLAHAAYVASAKDGLVTVVDGERDEVVARLTAEPGLGDLRFAPGGRLGFLLNPQANLVHVLDAASQRIVQTGKVEKGPDQVVFSDTIAYIRHRGSENVLMVPLDKAGVEGQPLPVGDFPGGRAPFGDGAHPSPADGIIKAPGMNAVLVANPADRRIYFYKEGMAAPMGELGNSSREPRALLVLDRSLKERSPGIYETTATLPQAGRFEVAFFLDTPRLVHCFDLDVAASPTVPGAPVARQVKVEPLFDALPGKRLEAGRPETLRLRLTDRATGKPIAGAADLQVLLLPTGGNWNLRRTATPLSAGLYEVPLHVPSAGLYYLYVLSPSLGLKLQDTPPWSLPAVREGTEATKK